MNALNLRVSSVKTSENTKKNAEMRTSPALVPERYRTSKQNFCMQFKNATKIPDQVAIVKTIFKSSEDDDAALQFLTDLYFYSPLKHPVRCQIAKLFITACSFNLTDPVKDNVIRSLANTLCHLVQDTRETDDTSKWNFAVTSIGGCFENFNCGLKALEMKLNIVFPFIYSSIDQYRSKFSDLNSPTSKNEHYLYVHNSIRVILSCVQTFTIQLEQQHFEELRNLNKICEEIINYDEIPMDPKTNSGILMAYIAKLSSSYDCFISKASKTTNPVDIALCVGIVNTFDKNDYMHFSKDIVDICKKIDSIANRHSTVPTILLCGARSLYQTSKVLRSMDIEHSKIIEDTKLILRILLDFGFRYLEHHMDSVRHICRDLTKNVLSLSKRISDEDLIQSTFDSCNSERLSLSMKCTVLLQAAPIFGSKILIRRCTDLFGGIFAKFLGREFIVNNLFECLMSISHAEIEFNEWIDLWITYLLNIAMQNDSRLPDIESLIVKSIKYEPGIVQYMIDHTENFPLSIKISTLWAVRKSGIQMENFNQVMKNFSQHILFSILSNCDETRMKALQLLVETHKSTELLTELECDHILLFLEYNSNCQSPAIRQRTLGLLSKALVRFELSFLKVLKDNLDMQNIIYSKFLLDFVKILVDNLFEGANFSRRTVSLRLLETCVQILIKCNLNLDSYLPGSTIQALINAIEDSYESNKGLAVSILKLIESRNGSAIYPNESLEEIKDCLLSTRPTDSVSGAYRLEFFCHQDRFECFGSYEKPDYCPVPYAALRWALNILKDGLKLGRKSILLAAKLNPLYGLLFAIKHLLRTLDFSKLSRISSWRELISEIIIICKLLTTVVGPIVNSSSPEGHLPNDFSDLPKSLQTASNKGAIPYKVLTSKEKDKTVNLKITSQMVLLCSWRTVKEVSLLLGDIVLRSPIKSNENEEFLITKEQLLEIGELFKTLLVETKHRGAFEQAYVGFSKLCARLWSLKSHELSVLPMTWLEELLSIISKDNQINEKICATRRSAGVPFMVQALITSELQVGTTKSLYFCIHELMQLCNDPDKSSEARSHAMNILRALFRSTDLNEAIGEFAGYGVMIALRGYEGSTWSERNSATLLFSALITRIFGVQRTKDADNLDVRNKMTGRIFFLRYPKLYDFFLEELQKASRLIRNNEKTNKLHPLLLILSRLYPSALEGTESNLKLSEFVPLISNCSGCPEMQTRYLAAKAIVPLVPIDSLRTTIIRTCAEIWIWNDPKRVHLNTLHGQLIQIQYFLKALKTCDAELVGDISSNMVTFHLKTKINNAVILKAILDIYVIILSRMNEFNLPRDTIQNLLYFSQQNQLLAPELSFYYPVFRKSIYIYNIHMLRLTLPPEGMSDFLLSPPPSHPSVSIEQTETSLNLIMLILLKTRTLTVDLEEFEINEEEIDFVRLLSDDSLDTLYKELKSSKLLHSTLKEVIQKEKFYPKCVKKAYAALSVLDHFDFTLTQLVKKSKKLPTDIKIPLTLCIERLVPKTGIDFKMSQLYLEYLLDITHPTNPDILRFKAAEMLVHIAIHFSMALQKKHIDFVKDFMSLVLTLLMDDDFKVRDKTANIILSALNDDIGMDSVVSTMAQRIFLQHTADLLYHMKTDDCYIVAIFKIVAELLILPRNLSTDSAGCSNSCAELEVFDKNESNVFAEPYKALFDNIIIYNTTFADRPKVIEVVNTFKMN